ncbi:MAG: hypothetical protein NTW56_20455 [Alphaproteobacteria bacterium]|jgi:hypothetical protein|nr:hypothetical protein [Alphaproteobacteria bacterium]
MATKTSDENAIPSGLAKRNDAPTPIRIAHPEDGEARGETWALIRAVVLLVAAILLVGWLLS